MNRLYAGDSLFALRQLPTDSVDGGVIDPPYGLSDHGVEEVRACIAAWIKGEEYRPKKVGFMGNTWDSWVPSPLLWAEVYRVLKPGAHAAIFAATRTEALMILSIQLAGFEIRDVLDWFHSHAFAKSHNTANDIDKYVMGHEARGKAIPTASTHLPGGKYATEKLEGNKVEAYEARTAEAAPFTGYGTALKPFREPIILVRKPVSERTVAHNAVKWGTGALHIDACRVAPGAHEKTLSVHSRSPEASNSEKRQVYGIFGSQQTHQTKGQEIGAFPPNVILSHDAQCQWVRTVEAEGKEAAKELKAYTQKGYTVTSGFSPTNSRQLVVWKCAANCAVYHLSQQSTDAVFRVPVISLEKDAFLHTAKANEKERYSVDGQRHPTVKPVGLIQWLAALILPPLSEVTLLDCFAGSGTIYSAARAVEKMGTAIQTVNVIGCEITPVYQQIIQARSTAEGWPLDVVSVTSDTTSAISQSFPEVSVFVKSVVSNVKRGVKAELGPRTLIVGPNGSGKTSIVNAVELALGGFASDVMGRTMLKKGIDLLSLLPLEQEALTSEVLLSNGEEASFIVERNGQGGARAPKHRGPHRIQVRFPATEVREALTGSAESAREWLLQVAGGNLTFDQITATFSEDEKTLYRGLVGASKAKTPILQLLSLRDDVSSRANSLSAEAKGAEDAAKSAANGLAPLPSEADLSAFQERLHVAKAEADRLRRSMAEKATQKAQASADYARKLAKWHADNEAPARASARYQVVSANLQRVEQQYAQLYAEWEQLQQIDSAGDGAIKLAEHALFTIEGSRDRRLHSCLVCAHKIDAADLEKQRQDMSGFIVAEKETAARVQRKEYLHGEIHRLWAECERLRAECEHLAAEAARTAGLPPEAPAEAPADDSAEKALAALRSELEALEAQGSTYQHLRGSWGAVERFRASAEAKRAEAESWRLLNVKVKETIKGLVGRVQREFEAKVQACLPPTDTFALQLEDPATEKQVCRFGFLRNGRLHTALSGAEWARLTLAMAAATSPVGDSVINIITPEERAWSSESLSDAMFGLAQAPEQIILCSTVFPAGGIPDGWTMIELSGHGF